MHNDAAGGEASVSRTRICPAYSRFPSLKKPEEFRKVYKNGRRVYGKQRHLFILNNEEGKTRLGVVVSKKNGNSVGRHRFARLVKEVFRLHRDELTGGFDLIVTADKHFLIGSGKELSYAETEAQLLWLLRKAKILCRQCGKHQGK